MSRSTGFILFAHGSSVESANAAVRALAGEFALRRGAPVEPAFLELGEPTLDTAVDRLAASGIDHIFVLPYFLTLGIHLRRDLPNLVDAAAARHAGVDIRIAAPLDGHPALADILMARADEVMAIEVAR